MRLTCRHRYRLPLFGVLLTATAGVVVWLVYVKPAMRPARISRSFPAAGVKKIILRAAGAEASEVTTDPSVKAVEVSGKPARSGRSSDWLIPNFPETPAAEWRFDFVSARHSQVLVISTKNEIRIPHRAYFLESLVIRVPEGVEVVHEPRTLTGNGDADLEAPKP